VRISFGLSFGASALLAMATCQHRLGADVALGEKSWLELRSDNFILRTDLPEPEARSSIAEMERMRSVFLRALSWGGSRPAHPRPLEVVLVDDLAELHQFSKPELEGFVHTVNGAQLVVMSGDQPASDEPVLKHEIAHAIAGQLLRRQPAWFAEGLACFLENTQRKEREERALIGEVDQARVTWLKLHGAMPAREILAAQSAINLPQREGLRFESSSYELFFLLVNERPGQLAAYMKSLVRGEDPAASFAALFPDLTPAAIDQLIHDSLSRFSNANPSERSVLLEPYEGTLRLRALPPAELHAQLGSLFELSPGRADRAAALSRARTEFAKALELDPGEPDALRASLRLANAPAEAWRKAARRAVALHPDRWKSQQLLVLALEDETPPPPERGLPARSDERLEAAQKAAVLAPFEPAAQAGLAEVLVRRGRLDEALPAALDAVALDPSDPTALSDLAVILAALHRNHEALGIAQRALEAAPANASPHFLERMKALRDQLLLDEQPAPPR
jgi:tetratricopeptide (TPR) repeat protein